ncbi:MAG: hypothetical protein FWF95_04415, partial [Syntrophorhabdaceae bacterium]|nr:hypothetical protein [Syntrophorhabdaceae bacterium]
ASISAAGLLTAKSVNSDRNVTVNASYTSGSVTKTASLTVTIKNVAATLSSIAINGAASVNEGTTATYTTTATWSNGTTSTVSPAWSLSSTNYASINSSGVLTAKSVNSDQTVTITASYTTAGVTKTTSKTVTIKNVPVTLSSIMINGISSVNKGASATYTAIASWSDGTTSIVSPTWSLSSTTYASIDSQGTLTAKNNVNSDQTVKITANYKTAGVTKTASKDITIMSKGQTVYPPAYPNNPRLSTKDEEIWKLSWDEVKTYANGDLLPANSYILYQAYWTTDASLKQSSLIELGRLTSDTSIDFQPISIGMASGERVFLLVRAILGGGEKSSLSDYLTWKVLYRESEPPKKGKIGSR